MRRYERTSLRVYGLYSGGSGDTANAPRTINIPIVPPIQFPLSVSECLRTLTQPPISPHKQNKKVSDLNDATQTFDSRSKYADMQKYAHETSLLCTDCMYTILYQYTSTTSLGVQYGLNS